MQKLSIRMAVAEDAAAIIACHREAVRAKASSHYTQDILDAWAPAAIRPEAISALTEEILDPRFIVLVAKTTDKEIAGFAMAVPDAHELRAVYVRPGASRGAGAGLLAAIVESCRARGCVRLEMDASLNAEGFYTAHGFDAVERGQHTLRNGLKMACVKMRLDL